MSRNIHASRALIVTLALLAAGAFQARAQDVRYETETTFKLGGTLGAAARFMGVGKPHTDTTYLKGDVLRIDSGDQSRIIDLGRELFIDVDHQKKQYSELTFAEFQQRLKAMMDQAQNEASGQPETAPAESTAAEADSSHVKFTGSVKLDRTGKTQTIDGHECSEAVLSMTVQGADTVKSDTSTLYATSDMWMAKDVKAYDQVQAFYKKLGEKLGQPWRASAANIGKLLAQSSPEAADSYQKLAEDASKLEGAPLLTVLKIETAASGKSTEEAQKKEDSGGGGLGGFFKKKIEKKIEKTVEGDQGDRALLFQSTTRLQNVSTASLAASLFQPPAGYTKVEMPAGTLPMD